MGDSYTDEELTQGVTWDPMQHGLQGLNDLALRLGATIARLQRERAAAQRVASEVPGMSATIDELRWELAEAQRVAKVLAEYAKRCREGVSKDEWRAVMAGIAYPDRGGE